MITVDTIYEEKNVSFLCTTVFQIWNATNNTLVIVYVDLVVFTRIAGTS